MINNNETITIFVAAPSDMDPERQEVYNAVARLNQRFGANLVVFDPTALTYQSDEDFQSQISQDGVVLVLTLLWYNIGTPLGDAFAREDGSRPTGTQFEYENAKALRRKTGRPDMLAYRKTADVRFEHSEKMAEFNQFWQKHFYDGESLIGSFKEFATTDEFVSLIERDIATWYRNKYQKPYWLEGCPYRGLQSFEPQHEAIFFGRDDNVKQLCGVLDKAGNHHFTLVLGASGSGKSSLVKAGLIPALQKQGVIFSYIICSPNQLSDEPVLALARQLFEALPNLAQGDFATPEQLASNPALFGLAIDGAIKRQFENQVSRKLLVLFDQFEELFHWADGQQNQLIAVLQALAKAQSLTVIACLRADFFNRWLDDERLVSLSDGNSHHYSLPSIRSYQLKDIIEAPAQAAGLTFERAAQADEQVAEQGKSLADVLLNDAEGQSDCLPLLQFTLEKLYVAKQNNQLTFAAYEQLGGITKAISKTADQKLASLPYGDSLFKQVISTLVAIDEHGNKSRQSAILDKFDDEERKLVNALIEARLLVAEQDKVRLSHDKLLEHWQSLNDWYQQDLGFRLWLARIKVEVISWLEHNRAKGYLLHAGEKVLDAQRFLKSYRQSIAAVESLGQDVIEFVQASSRLRRNKIWLLAGGVVAMMAVLIGLTAYSIQQQQIAQAQQQIAEQQKEQALTQQQKAEALLSQTRKTLRFMNFDLRDALQQYAPISVQAKITDQVDTLLTALQQHAPQDDSSRYDQAVALEQKADVLLKNSQAEPSKALGLYQQAHEIKQNLVEQNPDYDAYQHALSVSHSKLGDIYLRLGDTNKALASYQASLIIHQKLSELDEGNSQFKRDLSVSHERLGNIYLRLGDTNKALASYQASLVIRQKLSELDEGNSEFKRDLSVSHSNLGDIYSRLGDTNKALASYQASLDIDKKLSELDEGNSEFKRDLSVSHNKLGDIYLRLGDTNRALVSYQASLDIGKKLSELDEGNSEFKRDLSVSHNKLGDVYLRLGDTNKALASYQASLDIHKKLSELDEGNSEFKRDLSVSHERLGNIYLRLGDTDKALASYQAALVIAKKLSELDEGNSELKRGLSVSHERLGDIYLRLGDTEKALTSYQVSLDIAKKLSELDEGNVEFKRDLAASFWKMYSVSLKLNNHNEALAYIEQAHSVLAAMEADGVLAEDDKQYLQLAKDIINEMKK